MSTERITTDQAVAWARSRGAVPHVVDGSEVRSRDEALGAIGDALDFPPWYGRNLDALYDCLTDLSWLSPGLHVLVWSHHQTLAEHDWPAYQEVRGALLDGAAAGRRLTVMLTGS